MRFRMLFIFLICMATGFSQQVAVTELLEEAESRFWDFPEHSIRIGEYILTQHENNEIAARAHLILAKSYFVQDKIYHAAKAGFEAQRLVNNTDAVPLRIEAQLTNLQILQELLLSTPSDELKKEINLLKKKIDFPDRIDNRLILIEAEQALKNEEFEESDELYSSIDAKFPETDSIQQIRYLLGRAQLKMKLSQPKEALEILDNFSPDIPKYFRVIQLNLLGEAYFQNKNNEEALFYWNKAKELAGQLPNDQLANRSLEGLIQVYLIKENSKKYLDYKQESNSLTSALITDRVRAVNFTYNFFEDLEEQKAGQRLKLIQNRTFITLSTGIPLILLLLAVNYYYRLRIKEYSAFKFLTSPPSNSVKKEIFPKNLVSEETERELLKKLEAFEAGLDFTRSDMSIAFLASNLNTNTKYLSDVINRHKGKNFNGYINELRVNYIIHQLKTDPIYLNYKISYLAEECGFSSHSSFTTVFKSVTGISPTKFIGFLQKEGSYDK